MATVLEAYFGNFEVFIRLEGGISWVRTANDDEVKTKVILKSSSLLELLLKKTNVKFHSDVIF